MLMQAHSQQYWYVATSYQNKNKSNKLFKTRNYVYDPHRDIYS